MDNITLLKFLSDEDTRRSTWSSNCFNTSFETMPSEFINFAEIDLQTGFEHRYINALSNAKRALDCQADRLIKLFGYYQESQDKFWGFPRKIDLIQKFDILAPRVLNKINTTRNLMEHQYIKPNASQVEDFLDIVSLFIASTDRFASNSLMEVGYTNENSSYFTNISEVFFKLEEGLIKINTYEYDRKMDIEFEIKKGEADYIDILKKHIKKMEFR